MMLRRLIVGALALAACPDVNPSRYAFPCDGPGCPCSLAKCRAPPASCVDEQTLLTYRANSCSPQCAFAAIETVCNQGCKDGACIGEPCAGVTCQAPPANFCLDGSTLRAWVRQGTCEEGQCRHAFVDVKCASDCNAGHCTDDLCAGVSCSVAPPAVCEGTAARHSSAGACNNATGECEYPFVDTPCPAGCIEGACAGDPCSGVVCASPPAPYCGDPKTAVISSAGTCSTNGVCQYAAGRVSCGAGLVCRAGACVPGGEGGGAGGGGNASGGGGWTGGGSGGGGGSSSQTDGGDCAETVTATNAPANLMIVLDKSGSMDEPASDPQTTKWVAAQNTIIQMTTKYPSIDFGLTMFSLPNSGCSTGSIAVRIGANNADAIKTALRDAGPDGDGTPIAGGLGVGGQDPGLSDMTRSNGVVLITDGYENCAGAPVTEVKTLFRRANPVRTYVIGFGNQVDAIVLSNMAIQGGTARLRTPRYYQAEKQADVEDALKNISNSALLCSFTLSKTGIDPAKIFIGIDGQLVPRDPSHLSGWDYNSTTNLVMLYGPACDALASNPQAQLKVNSGCPGDITARDGGFSLDAGQ